jgi:hypothetical protein
MRNTLVSGRLALGHVRGREVVHALVGNPGPLDVPIAAVARAIAVLEPDDRRAVRAPEPCGLPHRRLDVVGVDEGDERLGQQLLAAPAQRPLPGGIQPGEIPLGRRGAEHVE